MSVSRVVAVTQRVDRSDTGELRDALDQRLSVGSPGTELEFAL